MKSETNIFWISPRKTETTSLRYEVYIYAFDVQTQKKHYHKFCTACPMHNFTNRKVIDLYNTFA